MLSINEAEEEVIVVVFAQTECGEGFLKCERSQDSQRDHSREFRDDLITNVGSQTKRGFMTWPIGLNIEGSCGRRAHPDLKISEQQIQ